MPTDLSHRPPQLPLVPPGAMECFAGDMAATISADVPLDTVQRRLAEVGQWLAVDGDASWPVGRLVEENSSGPLRLGFGAWRDLLMGVQFQNGRGELITAGARTVKNVAGYDLTKFMVGQRGVFGKVVTITTRTYRRPGAAAVARFAPSPQVLRELLVTECRPQWAVLTSEALWCGYLGDERTVGFCASTVGRFGPAEVSRRTVQEDMAHRARLWTAGHGTFRASVPPMRVIEFAQQAGIVDWSADAAFGAVIGRYAEDRRVAVEQAARAVGGSVLFAGGDGALLPWPADPQQRTILQALKKAFDPEGRLAPLPWL